MTDESGVPMRLLLAAVLITIVVGGSVDLYLDQPQDWMTAHTIYELVLIAAGLVGATALWLGWWRADRSVHRLRLSLAERSEERDRWRISAESALAGLGRAIARQFDEWALTPAEREVALLLLKGHSHKAAAGLLDRSERTVRQHAVSVYHKAGLAGRAELAAYFLGDLVLPAAERAHPAEHEPGEVDAVAAPVTGPARTGADR